VAPARPLRLKAEIVPARRRNTDAEDNAVKVWVDSGIFHLDSEFDYAIPLTLDDEIAVGVRIVVPFGTRECEAIVLKRFRSNAIASLKQISKVVSSLPVAHEESLDLIREVAKRWAAHPFDVVRSAIPPRVVSVEKDPLVILTNSFAIILLGEI
jgi:primosomal protein N' (replication factor Y)